MTRNRRTVTRRKDYDMLNKKESILTYIDDLQGLIRQNLEEVREKIAEGEDRKKLRDLMDEKLNVMNELKGNSKDDLQGILDLSQFMLDNLRFADGRCLKDCLEELKVKRRLEEDDDGEEYDDEALSGEYDDEYNSDMDNSIGQGFEDEDQAEASDQQDRIDQEDPTLQESTDSLTDESEAE